MLLHGICEEARGNPEGALARSSQNLAANGSNGAIVRNVEVIRFLLSTKFFLLSTQQLLLSRQDIFTILVVGSWPDSGQIRPESGQILARCGPAPGQNLAGFWPEPARTWRDPRKIWSEAGQNLARSWQCPAVFNLES